MSNHIIEAGILIEFTWETEYVHVTNTITMREYLENHLPENAELLFEDGTYAEIEFEGIKYEVHASGNGDFYNHKVRFEQL